MTRGLQRVVSVTRSQVVTTVYNIEVEDLHCYAVGELGVLVHNKAAPRKRKKRKAGLTAKEAAKDVPSWVKGEAPFEDENGRDFAKRLCDAFHGEGKYGTGPGSDYNKIKKYGDRAFE